MHSFDGTGVLGSPMKLLDKAIHSFKPPPKVIQAPDTNHRMNHLAMMLSSVVSKVKPTTNVLPEAI